ncbi:MAG: hypothetical protein ACKOPT_14360 [Cyanobium sp.]
MFAQRLGIPSDLAGAALSGLLTARAANGLSSSVRAVVGSLPRAPGRGRLA